MTDLVPVEHCRGAPQGAPRQRSPKLPLPDGESAGRVPVPLAGGGATFHASMNFQICASMSCQRGRLFTWVRQAMRTPPWSFEK